MTKGERKTVGMGGILGYKLWLVSVYGFIIADDGAFFMFVWELAEDHMLGIEIGIRYKCLAICNL